MKYSKDERIDALVHELIAKGAVLEKKGRSSHFALRFPNGHKQPIPETPSDRRSGLNWASHVKKLIAQGAFNAKQTTTQK